MRSDECRCQRYRFQLITILHLNRLDGGGLHFPHPCTAPSIEQKCYSANLNTYYQSVIRPNDFKRAIVSQWSKHKNVASFMLMESSSFVHFMQHKWEQNVIPLILLCLQTTYSSKIKQLTKWWHQMPPLCEEWLVRFTKPYIICSALPAELIIIWMLMNECVHHWMEISREELCCRELRTGVTTVYPASEQNRVCTHAHTQTYT